MAAHSFVPPEKMRARIRLAQIDALVSARLGPTRGLGNSQPACFNRQVAMYLGAQVGRWSTTAIGRFYDGRDHSTVCHGIRRIESLKETDPNVDALIADLKHHLQLLDEECSQRLLIEKRAQSANHRAIQLTQAHLEAVANVIAAEVWTSLKSWLETYRRF